MAKWIDEYTIERDVDGSLYVIVDYTDEKTGKKGTADRVVYEKNGHKYFMWEGNKIEAY